MRLVAYNQNDSSCLGIRRGDDLIELNKLDPAAPASLKALLEKSPNALSDLNDLASSAPASATRSIDGIDFAVPLADPSKIICLGLNYADHAKEGGHAKPEYPSFFMRGPSSLLAHNKSMLKPSFSDTLDYEAELVAVVGQRCRNVRKEDALGVIAGYSCFNDGSVREYQRKTSQWTIGKNFDATGGFGPEFVTADELPAGCEGLRIQSRLNGQIMQDANTNDMLFDVKETIELLTSCMTLEIGDLIVMGTPSGVGHARKPPVFMQPGDLCEIEIESVGLLSNPIA